MNNWFTADTHFGHGNIIPYCNRPFFSVEEMNSEIIRRWNERVKEEDTVYHLGDFCFKRSKEAPKGNVFDYYREQLNGHIILIQGNHDKKNSCRSLLQSALINHGGQQLFLIHNPEHYFLSDNKYNTVLCGHVHSNWKFQRVFKRNKEITFCNVGVDMWNFRPVSINEILGAKSYWEKSRRLS